MLAFLSIGSALLPLALLACPVGMGAMMFLMMRGGGNSRKPQQAPTDASSIAELKAEHARLAEQIDRLEQPAGRDPEPAER